MTEIVLKGGALMRRAFGAVIVISWSWQLATAAENPKVQKALETFDRMISAEAERLINANKREEANQVLQLQKAVEEIKPLSEPGKCASFRQALFSKRLLGQWSRPAFPDTYTIAVNNGKIICTAFGPAGNQTNRGEVIVVSAEKATLRFDSGHRWQIYPAGMGRLAIEELFGEAPSNDGIILVEKWPR